MNIYAVYHRKTIFEIDLIHLHWPEDDRLVASVKAENLEQVLAKTQHIDHEWWQSAGRLRFPGQYPLGHDHQPGIAAREDQVQRLRISRIWRGVMIPTP